MTTNGVLLDEETTAFLNAEMQNVVLSLDGRKDINDAMRPNAGGKGSYDTIVPRYQRFVAQRGDRDYYVRGTFTRNNLDFSQDVLHMKELGFDQVSVEPVVTDPDVPYSLREEDLPAIFEEYDRLARTILEMKRRGERFNFFHFMLDLEQGPCAIKRLRGCGCGNEYAAVDPEGRVFPCHQFVGQPEWQMGNVLTGEYDLSKRSGLPAPRCIIKRTAGPAGLSFTVPAAATPITSSMRAIYSGRTPCPARSRRSAWNARS